jgi:hypothetical protein
MRVVHAGMLTQKRSATAFLEALAKFFERRPEARSDLEVRFVGAREDESERAAARLGLGDRVYFESSLPHDEVLRPERQAHVLLFITHADSRYDGGGENSTRHRSGASRSGLGARRGGA